jgi:hypothetical protein
VTAWVTMGGTEEEDGGKEKEAEELVTPTFINRIDITRGSNQIRNITPLPLPPPLQNTAQTPSLSPALTGVCGTQEPCCSSQDTTEHPLIIP